MPQEQSGMGSVVGLVTGEGGAPVEQFSVGVFAWDSAAGTWGANRVKSDLTGADGRFIIADLPAGRYTVEYTPYLHNQYLPMWWGNHLAQADADGFEIVAGDPPFDASVTLLVGGKITGTVTTKGGGGLAGAHAEFHASGVYATAVSTDSNGNYAVEGLPPGSYTVHFTKPWNTAWIDSWWENGDRVEVATTILVELGSVANGIDGVLLAPSSVSGRLVDAGGLPVVGLDVDAWIQQGGADGVWNPAGTRATAADGTFTIGGLRAGRYRFSIAPPLGGDTVYAYQWWGGTAVEGDAQIVDVAEEQDVALGDDVLLKVIHVGGWTKLTGTSPAVGDVLQPAAMVEATVVPTRTLHWFRDGVAIVGRTGQSYVVQPDDLGARLSVREDLSAPGYVPVSIDFGESEPVGLGSFEVIEKPIVSGTPQWVGATLEAFDGHVEPSPTKTTYQWLRNGVAIAGQTSATYVTTRDDFGSQLSVDVTATRAGYRSSTRRVEIGRACYPASEVAQPIVGGTRYVGSTLSTDPRPTPPGMVVTYRWWANGAAISGGTGSAIKLTKAQLAKRITVSVTRAVPGCATVTSTSTSSVPKTALSSVPKITGTATRYKTLHVRRGAWTSKTRFSYRWYADGHPIASATKSTLRLTPKLAGKRITVSVTGKRSGYATVTRSSSATRPVR